MNRRLLVFLCVSAASAAPAAELAAQERVVPFFGGGLATGTGDLGQDTSNGWHLFGGLDLPFGTQGVTVGVTASYTHIPYGGGFQEATDVTGVFGEVGYVFNAASASVAKPYLRGGAGVLVNRYDPGLIDANATSDARAGLTAGAGVRLSLGATAVLLGAQLSSGTDAGHLAFRGALSFPAGGAGASP